MVYLLYIFKIDGDIKHLNKFFVIEYMEYMESGQISRLLRQFSWIENGRPHFGIPETSSTDVNCFKWDNSNNVFTLYDIKVVA